jgi:hypothetical protein
MDRGMIRTDQKADAQKAEFHFVTALTKPQIQKLLADQVLQLELFEEKVHEVLGDDGRRFVMRRNPVRQQEIRRAREQKHQALEALLQKANPYLEEPPPRPSRHPAPLPGRPARTLQGAGLVEIDRPQKSAGPDPRRARPPSGGSVGRLLRRGDGSQNGSGRRADDP